MKTKTAILLISALCMLLPLAGQAITVECHGFATAPITRDILYRVTLGTTESIDYLHNGWFADGSVNGWVSQGSDFIVVDALGVSQNWTINIASISEPYTNYVEHGLIATSIGNTDAVLQWQEDGGGSISDGVYYFGYNTEQPLVTVGFLTSSTVLNEDWDEPVGQGLGPIHAPVPEPATALLMVVATGAIGVFRRVRKY